MGDRLAAVVDALLQVVRDPASNPRIAVFIFAAAVVLVLIVIIGAVALMLPSQRALRRAQLTGAHGSEGAGDAEPEDSAGEPVAAAETPGQDSASGRASRSRRLSGALVFALVFAGLGAGYVGTGTDAYCQLCHSKSASDAADADTAAADAAHEGVACVRCHEDRGALVVNTVLRVADLGARLGLGESQYSADVRSVRCRACHRKDIAERSEDATSGIVMSHREPLDAGWACVDCHEGGGHSPMTLENAMSQCVRCHDAKQASAECDTCHAKDTSAASALSKRRIYGVAKITRTDCEGCHSQETCDECHGIRMPHTEEFLATHPRYSGFGKKAMCFEKCHTQADCAKCHGDWNAHGPNFRQEHSVMPRDSACNTCHSKHQGSMCALCHDFGG